MPGIENWIDLLDPTAEELAAHLPDTVHARAFEQIAAAATHDDEPRPKLETHDDYIFGVLLVAVVVNEEDLVFYQEIDLVMTADTLVTVRKTPPDNREPYDVSSAQATCRPGESVGLLAYHLVDDIAERYLDLVDGLGDEIEELEDGVENWDGEQVRRRISDLRHDMLRIRRTLSPFRDAVRQVVDDRIELANGEIFDRNVELNFAAAYDKLLRALEGLELARDLVAGARDFHQAKVANDQNEVMKRLTVIASVLLLPTFIVGFYGQNFHHIPELGWRRGYDFVWALIVVTTIGQLIFFKWRKWI